MTIACLLMRLMTVPLIAGLSISPWNAPQPEVRGIITDPLGGRIARASLSFRQGGHEYEVQTSSDGTYSIRLAPGVYAVTVNSPGFCKMSRSSFALRSDTVAQFDFELVLCAYDSSSVPFEEEELPAVDTSGLKPLLQFGCRKERGATEYTGLVQQGTYVRPVLTYDLWTLRANSITYDHTMQTLTAEGSVTWQGGKTTKVAQYVRILLHNPPEVTKVVP